MARFDAAHIRRYYDSNTAGFVAFGEGGGLGAIHRAVWAPGVTARRQAFHYVDDRILTLFDSVTDGREPHVVDLGCGVGASLCYMASRVPMRGTGITISPAQAAAGQARIAGAGLDARVTCLEGDFTRLPDGLDTADLSFAIESFVHAPAPEAFFASAARLVRPGGVLVVCDDVRGDDESNEARQAVERFCRGWHVNSLVTSETLRARARAAGFDHESTDNLSPYLELWRPRDRAIAVLAAIAGRLPWRWTRLDPLVGGSALQSCLSRGWVRYELSVFRRKR